MKIFERIKLFAVVGLLKILAFCAHGPLKQIPKSNPKLIRGALDVAQYSLELLNTADPPPPNGRVVPATRPADAPPPAQADRLPEQKMTHRSKRAATR